jgi:hypothetical protein
MPDIRRPDRPSDHWTREMIDDDQVGLHVRLVIVEGRAAVAYFATRGREQGLCTELGAMMGFCGANDAGWFTRTGGTWSVTTAASNSGEAATGEAGSDFGEVVGHWPALAYDRDGNAAIAYKDVHSGSIQFDDLNRADLELTWQSGGSFRHIPVDWGRSAGNFVRMVFDAENRPVILYYLPLDGPDVPRQGIWAARSSDSGTTWEKIRLLAGPTEEGPDVALDGNGMLHVAYYHATRGQPVVVSLTDPEHFESLRPDPDGRLALTYRRCTAATDGVGNCNARDDGVVFAFREASSWKIELVDEGESSGLCGHTPALGFEADRSPVIAYRCQALVNGEIDNRVYLARRDPL